MTQTYSIMTGVRPDGGACILCRSDSSTLSTGLGAFLDLGLLQSSMKKTRVPIASPTTSTIIMMPNCLRMRGCLCLTVGSGIGMGGFITSYFILSKIPVSFSHMVAFVNFDFNKILVNGKFWHFNYDLIYLQWASLRQNVSWVSVQKFVTRMKLHTQFLVNYLIVMRSDCNCSSIQNPVILWIYLM